MADTKPVVKAKLEASASGSAGSSPVESIRAQGDNSFRLALVIGGSVVCSILAVAIVVAISRDSTGGRDYVGTILPTLTAAITGFAGFLAGQRVKKE